MLNDGGQVLVALIFFMLLLGAAKAMAQKIILPLLGILVVALVLDHYAPELGIVDKGRAFLAYIEGQIPADAWGVVASKVNQIADWLMLALSGLNKEQVG